MFDVRIDGVVAHELGLLGKPDPAVFLEAARRLGSFGRHLIFTECVDAALRRLVPKLRQELADRSGRSPAPPGWEGKPHRRTRH